MGPIGFTGWELFIIALFLGVVGYGLLRSCEAGCGYVSDHVEVQWK